MPKLFCVWFKARTHYIHFCLFHQWWFLFIVWFLYYFHYCFGLCWGSWSLNSLFPAFSNCFFPFLAIGSPLYLVLISFCFYYLNCFGLYLKLVVILFSFLCWFLMWALLFDLHWSYDELVAICLFAYVLLPLLVAFIEVWIFSPIFELGLRLSVIEFFFLHHLLFIVLFAYFFDFWFGWQLQWRFEFSLFLALFYFMFFVVYGVLDLI